MAKGNGGTRGSNPRSMYGGGNAPVDEGMTPAQFQRFVNEIAGKEYPVGWTDLDSSERELALMEAGFTGFADDGAENILFPVSESNMIGWLTDAITNDQDYGSRANSDNYFTVGFKDGTMRSVGALGNEIELVRPITGKQSYATEQRIVRQSLKNVAYITYNDSFRETYWIANGGEKQFRSDTGYEKWTNGRGEKRRDYIQDDWI